VFLFIEEKMNTKKPKRPLSRKSRFNAAIRTLIKPTHFITLSLCQGRGIANDNGGVSMLTGDDAIYTKMHKGFVESLSKRLVNRTVWKFHRPILRSAFALEGGSIQKRTHAHMIINKPDDVDDALFCSLVIDTAEKNPWVLNSKHAVHIARLDSFSEKRSSVYYMTKDGFDRLSFT
jgi:hypothetical protein